jgi:hypothetical protein
MAEWTNATVLKTVEPKGSVGSNPTPSALAETLFGCLATPRPNSDVLHAPGKGV